MKIVSLSLHHIDQSKNELLVHDVAESTAALTRYIGSLIDNIFESGNAREYEFQSETKEVCEALKRIMDSGDFQVESETIGKRLLKSEMDAQVGIEHLKHPIPKGSLVQAHVQDDDLKTAIIISKADHADFLDEESFDERRGLPLQKKVFKAALITFDGQSIIETVRVYETGSAKYWWNAFLELNEKRSDSLNTRTALQEIDDKVFKPLKKLYAADHLVLRNSAIGYFRTRPEFELNDFVDSVLKDYKPIDEALSVEKVKNSIIKLQEEEQFDRRFNIDSKEIPIRRIPTDVWLREDVKISFMGDLESRQVATRFKDNEGNKFVKVRVNDEGYESFPDE